MTVATVYTLPMPKFVYVQLSGLQTPARIEADRVEKVNTAGQKSLILKKGDQEVGEFNGEAVQGWWLQDERGAQPPN